LFAVVIGKASRIRRGWLQVGETFNTMSDFAIVLPLGYADVTSY
jgi:hypothetical protein